MRFETAAAAESSTTRETLFIWESRCFEMKQVQISLVSPAVQ
jgi:hypothetical protein